MISNSLKVSTFLTYLVESDALGNKALMLSKTIFFLVFTFIESRENDLQNGGEEACVMSQCLRI